MSWIIAVFLLAAVVQIVYFYPQMPSKVASNFDRFGLPDRWTGKNTFISFYLTILVATVVTFVNLPNWLPKVPERFLKLPYKKFWFSPERRDATYRYLQRNLRLFTVFTLGFNVCLMQLVLLANASEVVRLHFSALLIFSVYLCLVLGWVMGLLLRFSRVTV